MAGMALVSRWTAAALKARTAASGEEKDSSPAADERRGRADRLLTKSKPGNQGDILQNVFIGTISS